MIQYVRNSTYMTNSLHKTLHVSQVLWLSVDRCDWCPKYVGAPNLLDKNLRKKLFFPTAHPQILSAFSIVSVRDRNMEEREGIESGTGERG